MLKTAIAASHRVSSLSSINYARHWSPKKFPAWIYCNPGPVKPTACGRGVCSSRRSRPPPTITPDQFLYKQMLAAGNRWVNDTVGRALADKKPNVRMSSRKAQRMAEADWDKMQQRVGGLVRTVRAASAPAFRVALNVLRIGRGLAIQLILRAETTKLGQRMSLPVRRLLQESCVAKCAREKYARKIREMGEKNERKKLAERFHEK